MTVGETLQLHATMTPENASGYSLEWDADKPAVAKVDAVTGLVTGVAEGTAHITAEVTNFDGTPKTKVLTITVAEAQAPKAKTRKAKGA